LRLAVLVFEVEAEPIHLDLAEVGVADDALPLALDVQAVPERQ
jgi:hypothetical protein